MSMDILTGPGGRLASLAKTVSTAQNKAGAQVAGDPDISDPAKLFAALLENPLGKAADKSEQSDDRDAQDSEANASEAAQPVAAAIVPQNLFSLAADLRVASTSETVQPDASANLASTAPAPVVDTITEDNESKPQVAADLSALLPEAAKKQGEAVFFDRKKAGSGDGKAAVQADAALTQVPVKAAAEEAVADGGSIAAAPHDADAQLLTAKQPAESSAMFDRVAAQPQQLSSRSTVTIDAKMEPSASAALARIDDIQIISERSSGSVKTLQIRLDPIELGSVTARIRVTPDNIEVHLIADKPYAAEALAADRSMIEKTLKMAGVHEDAKISVTVAERNAVGLPQSSSSQSAGHQQAGNHQQSQQGAGMQSGTDGNNGSQSQSQAQFMGGEGRRNDEAGQTVRGVFEGRASSSAASQDDSGIASAARRGLVV